jgi:hypothetical protein
MRKDMAKVVTESPRRGHSNRSSKWGRRLTKGEYALDDHGASRAPVSRHRQYGWNAKEFSDSLGPLRGYLRTRLWPSTTTYAAPVATTTIGICWPASANDANSRCSRAGCRTRSRSYRTSI